MPSFEIKRLSTLLGKGVVGEFAPTLLKGAILELFKRKGLTTDVVTDYVVRDVSLWELLGKKYQQEISTLGARVGNISWLNSQFLINAVKDEYPAVASLFLGWKKARNWLDRQVETIKNQVDQSTS